jgi:ABC-2 type transport system permease protein/oleandomycin transport system permease protein
MTAISISTQAPLARPAGGLRGAIADTLTITQRNLITLTRVPQLIVFSSVQPILFVLMFRYAFGGAIPIPGLRYVDYLMPGIYGQVVAFGAINTGVGLAEDKGKGLIERMRSLPMARSAVLAGRTLADVVRNAFVIVLMVVMGFIVGFRLHNGVVPYLGGLLLLLLFGFALSWVFALVGLSATNAETAQAAAFPLLVPLVFASSAFVPLNKMPGWLQVFSAHQPVTQVIDAMRALVLGQPAANHVLQSLAWSVGIVAVFAPLAVRRYRRAT